MGFQRNPLVQIVIMTLIVTGGIGFLALEELNLLRQRRREGRTMILSLHTKMVLLVTIVLLLTGWLAYTALEWTNTLDPLPVWAKMLNGLFMSVTARTAGFNTVDYAATADSTNFVTILLMSIGGSPGSTAGGIKTTTVAVIGLLAYARLRGHQVTSVQHRSIPEETVQRAVGLFVVGFLVVTGAILLYAIVQVEPVGPGAQGGFLRHMFEAVSAFNTVGLSMGVTGELAGPGKLLTIFLMYVGRVGPLTFASAIALRGPSVRGEFRYAYEDVIIG
jgi:trk system potassium uptake protein TrkH